jgi:hypothetical protein
VGRRRRPLRDIASVADKQGRDIAIRDPFHRTATSDDEIPKVLLTGRVVRLPRLSALAVSNRTFRRIRINLEFFADAARRQHVQQDREPLLDPRPVKLDPFSASSVMLHPLRRWSGALSDGPAATGHPPQSLAPASLTRL